MAEFEQHPSSQFAPGRHAPAVVSPGAPVGQPGAATAMGTHQGADPSGGQPGLEHRQGRIVAKHVTHQDGEPVLRSGLQRQPGRQGFLPRAQRLLDQERHSGGRQLPGLGAVKGCRAGHDGSIRLPGQSDLQAAELSNEKLLLGAPRSITGPPRGQLKRWIQLVQEPQVPPSDAAEAADQDAPRRGHGQVSSSMRAQSSWACCRVSGRPMSHQYSWIGQTATRWWAARAASNREGISIASPGGMWPRSEGSST